MQRWCLSWILAATVAGLAGPARAAVTCPDLDVAGLQALAATQPATHLIFFATWCTSCVEHLRQAHPAGSLLIASFSERAAAEQVVAKLSPQTPCYFDKGLTASFHVQAVPAQIDLDSQARPR